jgi:capsular exopolysaccharide synthesis family protein
MTDLLTEGPVEKTPDFFVGAPELSGGRDSASALYGALGGTIPQKEWRDYVKVLSMRRWTVIGTFSVILLSTIVYAFTTTPIYEAHAKILIESDEPNVVGFKEVVEPNRGRNDYYQTQYDLLKSRTLARRTLDTLNLWDHPLFRSGSEMGSITIPRAITQPFARLFLAPAVRTPDQSASPPSSDPVARYSAIDSVLANLVVAPVRNSRIVDVRFRSVDPEIAARLVNTHLRGYIEQNTELKFLSSKEATNWLGERLGEQAKQLQASEAALQQYREQNDAISFESSDNIVVRKLGDLNAAVTRAKTERIEQEALYSQLEALQSDRAALDSFPTILANVFIQQQKAELSNLQRQYAQMAEKLGDRHPDLVKSRVAIQIAEAKLQAEIAKVVQSVRSQFMAAKAQEESLISALDAQKAQALAMNRKSISYGVLARDAESNRLLYQSLLQRAKETGVSTDMKMSSIRIVDDAERPRSPVTPNRRVYLLAATIGGMIASCGLALFFEGLDNRFKTPDDVRRYLGLPSLGMVPTIPNAAGSAHGPLISNGVPPMFVEAFRVIRSNLLFSSAGTGCRSLVVTSAGPGEGKTTVASNLAIGLAQADLRVLLIDGDMRRPRLHEVFTHPQEPGLSNLMVGNAKATEVVHQTSVPRLWTVSAGRTPPNPAELLGSKRFQLFLQSLRDHFDWVIIDSPPAMAVTDASVVAHVATDVLFVIGAEMADRRAAREAIGRLEAAHNAQFVGAILNHVKIQRNSYFYSSYHRREYETYYQAPTQM